MGSEIPKHYADIPVPQPHFLRRVWMWIGRWFAAMADVGKHPSKLWHLSARWPVFGVILALGIGVTSIGEYGLGCGLILLSAFSLLSKLWHTEDGWFLRIIGAFFIAFVLMLATIVVWDAKGNQDWSRLPHASHRLMVALGISKEQVLPVYPRPQFAHDIRISHDHPYKNGIVVDGIKWRADLREYFFTIQNISQNVEVSNFREHLFLPVAALQMEIVSCLGCEGVSISMGDGSSKTVIIQDGKIVRADDNSGMNDVSVAVSRMLPEATLTMKMIASAIVNNPNKVPGVMMYGSNFVTPSGLEHFGRMIRFMTVAEDGKINIGPELHKRGQTFQVPIIWSIGGPLPERSQAITPGVRVSQDVSDRPDDE